MIVLCNGMMRSGSTLQYNVVRDLLESTGKDYIALGYYDKEKIQLNISELVNKSKDKDVIYILKSHDYTKLNEIENIYVIYSYRNLLDVAASLKRKFGVENHDLISSLKENLNNYHKIKNSKKILTHTYDNLLNSLYSCVEETSFFLGLNPANNIISQITIKNSPANLFKVQNKKKTLRSLKRKLLYLFVSSNKGIKDLIIKYFGRKNVNKIKNRFYPHDKESLLHLNHISDNHGRDGNWIEILNNEEINMIKTKFKNWV